MNKRQELHINYPKFVDEAMRGLALRLINLASKEGLKGDHYFLITFLTKAKGVEISTRLKKKYPEEMTIILQHQFDNLVVNDSLISVDLSFDGIRETITIPTYALTGFADPSSKFALQFNTNFIPKTPKSTGGNLDIEKNNDKIDNKKIVSLDQFRKNQNK